MNNRIIFGESNTVALSIKQQFWEVNSRNVTKIVGAATGNINIRSYGRDEIPHPFDILYHFITGINKGEHKKRLVVFVKRTCVADYIAQKLNVYGVKAVSVYDESSSKFDRDANEKRNRLIAQFIEGKVHVLVATEFLSCGTDMEVDYVINYDIPLNYFDYVNRCGRTGRNQKSATAITFVDLKNEEDYSQKVLQQIITNNEGEVPEFLLDFVENVKNEAEMEFRENIAEKQENKRN
uniref:Helicase C-terminal domain-containing protein n=1 Tax=Panagrolaimus sp. ES5 TaxID=591445 RepID=A0AC34FPF7_9BILA